MKRVALIEDDPTLLMGAARALRKAGFEAFTFANSEELNTLRAALPDIVVVDVNLEDVFGDDVCNFLRQQWQLTVPIYLWSAMPEDMLRKRTTRAGASGYICKDWGFDELVTRLQIALEIPAATAAPPAPPAPR